MPPQDTGRTLFWRKLNPLSRSEKSVCLLWTQNGAQLQEPNCKAFKEEDPFKGVVSLEASSTALLLLATSCPPLIQGQKPHSPHCSTFSLRTLDLPAPQTLGIQVVENGGPEERSEIFWVVCGVEGRWVVLENASLRMRKSLMPLSAWKSH